MMLMPKGDKHEIYTIAVIKFNLWNNKSCDVNEDILTFSHRTINT